MTKRLQAFLLKFQMRPLLATAVVFGSLCPSLARPLNDVVASGFMRIAVYSENKPWSGMKNGKPTGIDVDLAEAIAAQLKVKAEIVVYDASEDVGGDFRLNLWRGDLAGSPLSDLMLQVPNDRLLTLRDDQIFLTAPYFMQKLAIAYNKEKLGKIESLDDIGSSKVAVEGTSASDTALMTRLGGRLRPNASHFISFEQAAKAFTDGETPIIAGTEAQIEAAFFDNNIKPADDPIIVAALAGPVKNHWELAGAVRANSRDLADAVSNIINAMVKDGRMKAICEKYGVTFSTPDLD